MKLSNLLFVDNTLILCEASKEPIECLSWTFMWFEAISTLKFNLEKSELTLVGEFPSLE